MFLNLFLLGAELFKEYYSATEHLLYTQYFWSGIGEHKALVPYAWGGLACSVISFFIFLVPRWRRNMTLLNIGCVLIYTGVYIEKGMGLVMPGMTPDTLGEIFEYQPTWVEWFVSAGIYGIGFLVFTLLVKVAVPIMSGEFHKRELDPTGKGRRSVGTKNPVELFPELIPHDPKTDAEVKEAEAH
jgi:molybdopterin-containing oxidoreductase family membrane subunit